MTDIKKQAQQWVSQWKSQAQLAASRAYNRYSQFAVGAVLINEDGQGILGCNVENASYGLANCAERSALFSALSQGCQPQQAKAMVLYTPTDHVVTPCGACRQVIMELMPSNALVVSCCNSDEILYWPVRSLIPDNFSLTGD